MIFYHYLLQKELKNDYFLEFFDNYNCNIKIKVTISEWKISVIFHNQFINILLYPL
jgi:hypothetical protein